MTYATLILSIAKTVGVPGSLLLAICTHESHLTNVIAQHDHGSPSYGLCQIKEDTAKSLGFNGPATGPTVPNEQFEDTSKPDGKGIGLMDPATNVKYAALYLKSKLEQYDGDWCKSVSAYNSGTYRESKKSVGKPMNLKYVQGVTLLLDDEHKDFLVCGPRKVEE